MVRVTHRCPPGHAENLSGKTLKLKFRLHRPADHSLVKWTKALPQHPTCVTSFLGISSAQSELRPPRLLFSEPRFSKFFREKPLSSTCPYPGLFSGQRSQAALSGVMDGGPSQLTALELLQGKPGLRLDPMCFKGWRLLTTEAALDMPAQQPDVLGITKSVSHTSAALSL